MKLFEITPNVIRNIGSSGGGEYSGSSFSDTHHRNVSHMEQSGRMGQFVHMQHNVSIPTIMAKLYATFRQWYPAKDSPFAQFEQRLNKLAALYAGARQRIALDDMIAIVNEYNDILPKVQAVARDKKLHDHRRMFKNKNHPGHGAKYDRMYWRLIDEILALSPEHIGERS